MFSRKFQRDLYKEKYNSMKQLDRIEFQNKEILSKNDTDQTFYILGTISWLFSLAFIGNYTYLLSIGFTSSIHYSLIGAFFSIGFLFFVIHYILLIYDLHYRNRISVEREKFLEEHIK